MTQNADYVWKVGKRHDIYSVWRDDNLAFSSRDFGKVEEFLRRWGVDPEGVQIDSSGVVRDFLKEGELFPRPSGQIDRSGAPT